MDVYENLKKNNIEVPKPLEAKGMYLPVNRTGNLVYLSGQGSIENGVNLTGRVGVDVLSKRLSMLQRYVCSILWERWKLIWEI